MIGVLYLVIALVVAVVATNAISTWAASTPPFDPDRGPALFIGTLVGAIWPITVPLAAFGILVALIAFKGSRT